MISVEPVSRRRDLAEFVRFPERLHRSHHDWTPPLRKDEHRLFDPRHNRALAYCDHALWLARDEGGATVGRIVGIINRRYNEARGERTARFSHIDCIESLEVASVLLERVRVWAGERGMRRMIGPMGFTDQDPEGLLVDGFDEEPSIASYFNFPYVVRFLEALAWMKEVDYVVYKVPVPETLPPVYERVFARVMQSGRLRLLEFDNRRQLRPFIRPILDLMNETFRDLIGYSELDAEELADLERRYRYVVDPRFVKVVLDGEEVIGFIIALPNLAPALRRARGRLLPVGWLWLLRADRLTRRLDLLLGGIREAYRGRGVDVLLGAAMVRAARRSGFEYMDSHHELESNTRVQAEMQRMGGTVYKRYRVYQRTV